MAWANEEIAAKIAEYRDTDGELLMGPFILLASGDRASVGDFSSAPWSCTTRTMLC
jgi:hypothetical protein